MHTNKCDMLPHLHHICIFAYVCWKFLLHTFSHCIIWTPRSFEIFIHHKTNCHDVANNSQEQPIKECKVLNLQNLLLDPTPCNTGFLIGAGSRVPAPIFFKQSTRLLKVRNLKKKKSSRKKLSTSLNINSSL